MSYSEEADRLRLKLAASEARHAALKKQVEALSNDGLDLDVLEIEARRNLFVSGTNEITIWLDP